MNKFANLRFLSAFCALSSLLLITGCGKVSATKPAEPPPVAVTVASPIMRKVKEWDEFTGRLAAPETVEVRARVSGYIEKVNFTEGSEVKEGDLLFTIDKRPYQATVERLRAELGAARSRYELAAAEAKRAEGLAATQAISVETLETRTKAAVQAQEAVRSAEANLKLGELDLEFTAVRAPISGRVSYARVTAGNLITGGSAANSTILTTIVSLDPIYCYFEADEASVLKYRQLHREGKRVAALFAKVPAEMELQNEEKFPHKGFVDFVDNELNPATGTIRARAVFPNPDRLMSPGFFARVRIPADVEHEAILVRDSAILSDQGRSYVLTLDENDTAVYRPIKIGPLVDGMRVVREGLEPSDRLIVSGLMNARPGSKTQPAMTNMLAAVSVPASVSSPQ